VVQVTIENASSDERQTDHGCPFSEMLVAGVRVLLTAVALVLSPATNAITCVQARTECPVVAESSPETARREERSKAERCPNLLEGNHRCVVHVLMRDLAVWSHRSMQQPNCSRRNGALWRCRRNQNPGRNREREESPSKNFTARDTPVDVKDDLRPIETK
jgi:hypothetical protein